MKTLRIFLSTTAMLVALGGVFAVLAWGQASAARVEDKGSSPAAPISLPTSYLNSPNAADAPYGITPTLDGRISPGEYAGASKITFPTYGSQMEVFIIQNAITLYIGIDSPDTTPYPYNSGGGTGPAFQVFLDTHNDKMTTPQVDDYRLTLKKNGSKVEDRGGGGVWGNVPVGNWNGKVSTATWGWQGEYAIRLSKLDITQTVSISKGLGLAEVWTPSWPKDWYWPAGGYYLNPSTWGNLTSSSQWGNFYWKPGPWQDYAPSGLPDFDQRQDNWSLPGPGGPVWTHCGPVAVADSLWWFDSKYEQHPVGPVGGPPSTIPISDSYTLVKPYGSWDDHDPQNVISFTNDLANNYFGTNQFTPGTNIYSMYIGIQRYLRDRGLWDDYIVTLVNKPEFDWIAKEVMRSEDVILLLGFWQQLVPGGPWVRISGHYVTVAGVDLANFKLALSDPIKDNAEGPVGGPGRVLNGQLIPHTPQPGHPSNVHNDAGNISHDVYGVQGGSASPGGSWWIPGYEPPIELLNLPGLNPNPKVKETPVPWAGGYVQTEIEYALAVSPYTWKASGSWVKDDSVSLYHKRFSPYLDFAPSGVPDFNQLQQNSWGHGGPFGWQLSFCGPVAAADSLWWFDSKFEPNGSLPPAIHNIYPLVNPYGAWDDHHPKNVNRLTTLWPPPGWPITPPISPGKGELVEDLALYFKTDQPPGIGSGTVITDVYNGLQQYLVDHGLRQGYAVTKVKSPDYWWVAEEVERSEDVILLLGFWANPAAGIYERVGGHYVTLAGVDKQSGYVAFSDPFWDRMEEKYPPNEFIGVPKWSGRIGSDGDPLLGPSGLVPTYTHIITYTAVYTLHNDAANISHDSYRILPTNSPGGIWGPAEYASMSGQVVNFVGMNGVGINPGTGIPIVTEVEWAVAVSPVADVWITKEVTPTTVRYGDWITFTLAFTNVGSLPAQNVVITDTLPSQLANASWTGWLSNSGNIKVRGGTGYVWDVADLAWGEWGKITVTAQVNAMDLNLVVNNTAKIGTSSVEQYQVAQKPNTATIPFNINNVTYDLDATPISVTLSGYPGKSLYFDLVITNTGNVTDTISITHTFPITWTIAFTPTAPYILAPTESQAIRVCLVIPVEAEAGSREAEIVTFRSQGDPSVSVDVDVIVDILWRYIFLPIITR